MQSEENDPKCRFASVRKRARLKRLSTPTSEVLVLYKLPKI